MPQLFEIRDGKTYPVPDTYHLAGECCLQISFQANLAHHLLSASPDKYAELDIAVDYQTIDLTNIDTPKPWLQ